MQQVNKQRSLICPKCDKKGEQGSWLAWCYKCKVYWLWGRIYRGS